MKMFLLTLILGLFLQSTVHANVIDGAKELKGHYYKIFEFKMSWTEAKKFCESMGGHLATIETDDENGPIRATLLGGVNKDYWLGGYRDSRNVWKWISGSIITDSNWDSGYPLDWERRQYLYISRHYVKWGNDENDNYLKPFICEWDSKEFVHESNW